MCDNIKRAAALGYFDGLHLAHIKVLEAALSQKENGLTPLVPLFDEAPSKVIAGVEAPRLMSAADRDRVLEKMGFEVVKLHFCDIRDMEPEQFVSEVLKEKLNVSFVSCGYNYSFGKNGTGNTRTLRKLCEKYEINLHVCRQVRLNGETVSSTAVRNAVKSGDIEKANGMLGRPLSFVSTVLPGEKRGRLLGFPTVNQLLPEGFIVPKCGVYASIAEFCGQRLPAVTDIGSRPTFSASGVRSETHIMDFSGDLYGKEVRISLIGYIREEKKFPSAESLIEQIRADASKAAYMVSASNYF